MTCTGGIGHALSNRLLGCGTQDEAEDEAEVCVLCCQKRSTVAISDECKEHYCTECIDTHTCGTNVMMRLYCSRYLNNAYRFYWRSMRLCYPNPPFSQLAKVLTKIALKGARVVLCTPVCNFLELGQFGSPNSKGVSKGCAWGLFEGNIV